MNGKLDYYLKNYADPHPNADGIREDPVFSRLFATDIPKSVNEFELDDKDRKTMSTVWPAGEDEARRVRPAFLTHSELHIEVATDLGSFPPYKVPGFPNGCC